jgi:hypothetical protein
MSYNDVYKLRFKTFDRVLEIVNQTKPYKGSTNIYPLGARRYADRSFVFHGDHIVIRYGLKEVMKFHNDNSVEFLNDNTYQGPNMMMSAFLYPYTVKTDCRMGGDIICNDSVTHPIFKGLRVYLADLSLHPTVNYKLFYKTVDRSKSKELRKSWEEQIKAVKAFFLVSDSEQMINESNSLRKTPNKELDTYEQFLSIARSLGFMRLSSEYSRWGSRSIFIDTHREQVFKRVRDQFFEELYDSEGVGTDVFEWKEAVVGKKAPAGNRGVKINYRIEEAV